MRLCEYSALSLLRKAPPKRGFNYPHACWRRSPQSLNAEPEVRFDGPDDL
jgi:hypothetical protein